MRRIQGGRAMRRLFRGGTGTDPRCGSAVAGGRGGGGEGPGGGVGGGGGGVGGGRAKIPLPYKNRRGTAVATGDSPPPLPLFSRRSHHSRLHLRRSGRPAGLGSGELSGDADKEPR